MPQSWPSAYLPCALPNPEAPQLRAQTQRTQDLQDDGIGSEWILGLEKAVGAGAAQRSLPASFQGKIGDRVGFFPANFVQRVRPGENVWRCCQPFSGNKEQGYMSLKENQVRTWALHGWRGWRRREISGRNMGEHPGGGGLEPGGRREGRLEAMGQGTSLVTQWLGFQGFTTMG